MVTINPSDLFDLQGLKGHPELIEMETCHKKRKNEDNEDKDYFDFKHFIPNDNHCTSLFLGSDTFNGISCLSLDERPKML